MRCIDAQNQLVAAEDGELGPSAVELLEAHLASCERCRAWDERMRAMALGGTLMIPPRVRRSLDEATDPDVLVEPGPEVPREHRSVGVPTWTLAFAATAAVALLGWGVKQNLAAADLSGQAVVHMPIPSEHRLPTVYYFGTSDVPTHDTNVLHPHDPSADGGPR